MDLQLKIYFLCFLVAVEEVDGGVADHKKEKILFILSKRL